MNTSAVPSTSVAIIPAVSAPEENSIERNGTGTPNNPSNNNSRHNSASSSSLVPNIDTVNNNQSCVVSACHTSQSAHPQNQNGIEINDNENSNNSVPVAQPTESDDRIVRAKDNRAKNNRSRKQTENSSPPRSNRARRLWKRLKGLVCSPRHAFSKKEK